MAEERSPATPPGETKESKSLGGIVGFIVLLVVGVGVGSFLKGGGAQKDLVAEARLAAARGERARAVEILLPVAQDPSSPQLTEARNELALLAEGSTVASVPLSETALVVGAALEAAAPVSSETVGAAIHRVDSEAVKDPKGASELATRLFELVPATNELRVARLKAYTMAYEKDRGDTIARIALAGAWVDAADWKKARELLEPVADALGDGDGARVLGLAFAQTGAEDKGFDFLRRYFDSHVDGFKRATDGLKAADDANRDAAVKALRMGDVPPAFQRRLDEAPTEAARNQLLDSYVRERGRTEPLLRKALRAVYGSSRIGLVAVELGRIELERAVDRPAPERRAHLEAAEKYYMSVIDLIAGDDMKLLFIARIRFDLGREKEAREILDELLRRRGRTGEVFLALSVALERLPSARGTVRELAEQAYGALSEGPMKEKAAAIRYQTADDTADQVAWLERAGSATPIPVTLLHARAALAREEGRFDEATTLLDETIANETSATPVHAGRVRLERFACTGDKGDLDAAIDLLEKAAVPKDAPVEAVDYLADTLLMRAFFDLAKDRAKIAILREARLDLVHFVAADEKDLLALVAALEVHPDRRRALELRERALSIDPSFEYTYEMLVLDASACHDAEALTRITERLAKAPFDRLGDRVRDYWSGKEDAALRAASGRLRKQRDAFMALARASGDAPTLARALCARATAERDALGFGGAADPDLDVRLCEEAEKLAPRPYTRLALESALVGRALAKARRSSKALDELARGHGKLGAAALLALAGAKDPALAAALAKDEDIVRAAALIPKDGERQTFHLWVVRAAGGGSEEAKRLAGSALALARARADLALAPGRADSVLELVTLLEARGSRDEAQKLLAQAEKDAIALPYSILR